MEVDFFSKSYLCIIQFWIIDVSCLTLVLGGFVVFFHTLVCTAMILAKK